MTFLVIDNSSNDAISVGIIEASDFQEAYQFLQDEADQDIEWLDGTDSSDCELRRIDHLPKFLCKENT